MKRLLSDPVLLSKRNALPKALSKLEALHKVSESERLEGLLSVTRNFIGDKAGRRGESLTAAEARTLLEQLNTAEPLRNELHNLMSQLESLVYSGLPEQSRTEELQKLEDGVRQVIQRIDEGKTE